MPSLIGTLLARTTLSGARARNYLRSLVASYASIVVSLAYTGITVPLGLTYLEPHGWGTWVLCLQVSTTIALFEHFGSGAFVRLLVRFKDDPYSISYKNVFWVGQLTFLVQGLLFFALHLVLGYRISLLFPGIEDVSSWYVLALLGMASMVQQWGKAFGHILYAHQRVDLQSVSSSAGLVLNLALVYFLLPKHPSPVTFAIGTLGSQCLTACLTLWFSVRSRLLPGCFPMRDFKWSEFLSFMRLSQQFFLHGVMSNVVNVLPTLVVGRVLGVTEAGVWGVIQRVINMFTQLLRSMTNLAQPAFMEMSARGEEARLRLRTSQILGIQNTVAALALGLFAAIGRPLLEAWTSTPLGLSAWFLPTLGAGLLADFDQRFRFDLDTVKMRPKRALVTDVVRLFAYASVLPASCAALGIFGVPLSTLLVCAFVMLPLSVVLNERSFPGITILPMRATLVGNAVFCATLGLLTVLLPAEQVMTALTAGLRSGP